MNKRHGGITTAALKQYVAQIEQIDAEIKDLNTDKSEIYKAAKQAGADIHVLKWVIAERRKDPEQRRSMGLLFGQYWDAIHHEKSLTPALDNGAGETFACAKSTDPLQIDLEEAIDAHEAAE